MSGNAVSFVSETVKQYFEKLRGASVTFGERPLIDWLDFDISSIKEQNGIFVVECGIRESLFSQQKNRYRLKVSKEGNILEVQKEK